MNNLKRVLSLALASVMLIGMMVVGASAAEFTDADEIQHQEAVDILVALDIVNGKEDGTYFAPGDNVTRGEMAKMIAVAMKGGNDVNTGTKGVPSFTDIAGHWAESYIEYCYDLGIIAGRGDGTFDPNANVTGTEVTKMVLTALGYDAEAYKLQGASWATRTDELARTAKPSLYEDLTGVTLNVPATRDTAAQIIWNGMQNLTKKVNPGQNTSTGEVTWNYADGKDTLLGERYGGKIWYGKYTGNYDTGKSANEGEITITGGFDDDYSGDADASFPSDLDISNIGEKVKVIYKDGTGGVTGPDKKDTIYGAFNTGDTTVYNVTKADLQDSESTTKIKFGGTKYELSATSIPVVTNYITDAPTTVTAATINKNYGDGWRQQSLTAIKFIADDNNRIEAAYVVTYGVAKVTAVTSAKITLSGVGSLDIADHDVAEDLKVDDVVVYTKFYSAKKDDATYTVVKAETVEGKMTGFKSGWAKDNNNVDMNADHEHGPVYAYTNVVIDGTTYKIDNKTLPTDLTDDSIDDLDGDTKDVEINDTVKAYLFNGMVVALDSVDTSGGNYAVVTDSDITGDLDSNLKPVKVTVLLTDGTEATYSVHKDSKDLNDDEDELDKELLDKGAVVEYSLSGGKLKIKNVWTAGTITGTATGVERAWDATTKKFTGFINDGDGNTTENTSVASANAYLFVAKLKDGAPDKFSVYKLRELGNIKNTVEGLNAISILNKDGQVKVGYVEMTGTPTGDSTTTTYGIVNTYIGTRELDDTTYAQYTVKTTDGETITIYSEADAEDNNLAEREIIKFNRTSNDRYEYEDFDRLITLAKKADEEKVVDDAWYLGAIKSYSANILSYYSSSNRANVNVTAFTGYDHDGGTGVDTYATTSDVKVLYVDYDNKTAGDNVGISAWNPATGYPNVLFHIGTDEVVDYMIIESSGDKNMDSDNFAVTTPMYFDADDLEVEVTGTSDSTWDVAKITSPKAIDDAEDEHDGDVKVATGANFTVTVKCIDFDSDNYKSETVTVTYNGKDVELKFTGNGTKTATFASARGVTTFTAAVTARVAVDA